MRGKLNREIGWDFTFSVPKSVSVVWSQAKPSTRKVIELIHESAVRKTLTFLEENTTTRRGKGGALRESATLVTAIFEHGTSRELDPNLHSHTILLNLGIRPSDRTSGAIQINELLDYKILAGALYRAELAKQLGDKLGFEIGSHLEGNPELWDMRGVDKSLVKTFSKRRKQIQAQLKRKGLKSAIAASVAALDTRIEKQDINRRELFSVWQRIGASYKYRSPDPKFIQYDLETAKRKLGTEALEMLLKQGHSFTQKELMRCIATRAPQTGLGIDDIQAVTQQALQRKDLMCLGDLGDGTRYTTQTIHQQAISTLANMDFDMESQPLITRTKLKLPQNSQLQLHL